MKLFFHICVLLALLCAGHNAAAQTNSFTIAGQIDGLKVGDQVVIDQVNLNGWKMTNVDTVVVSTPDCFRFSGTNQGAQLYMLTYKPANGQPYRTCIRGRSLFVGGGEITLREDLKHFYTAHITGGFYDHPIIKEITALENASHRELIDCFSQLTLARANGDSAQIKALSEQYSQARLPKAVRVLENRLIEQEKDHEFSAYLFSYDLYDMDIAPARQQFEQFSTRVKESPAGKAIEEVLRAKSLMAVGEPAPDFRLVTSQKKSISLSDYKGHYLLIYHWGICPGTVAINPSVEHLYHKYKESGLQVLGWTDRDIRATIANDPELKSKFEPMTQHPWETVFVGEQENEYIKELYLLDGVPMLFLISPEGVIKVLGYNKMSEIEALLKEVD